MKQQAMLDTEEDPTFAMEGITNRHVFATIHRTLASAMILIKRSYIKYGHLMERSVFEIFRSVAVIALALLGIGIGIYTYPKIVDLLSQVADTDSTTHAFVIVFIGLTMIVAIPKICFEFFNWLYHSAMNQEKGSGRGPWESMKHVSLFMWVATENAVYIPLVWVIATAYKAISLLSS